MAITVWDKKHVTNGVPKLGGTFSIFHHQVIGVTEKFRMSRAGKVTCRFAIENGDFEIVDLAIENGGFTKSCLMFFCMFNSGYGL